MKDFMKFVREQGVVGLAVGFILGGAVGKLVEAIITDIVNPLLSLILGLVGGLTEASISIGSAQIMWGHLVSIVIDFVVILLVVYFGVKLLRLEKLVKKK